MSALNFPNSPTVGQTYVVGTITYTWNGESWASSGTASPLNITTQTGTTYTAALTDARSMIMFTSGATVTFTIPPESSVAWSYPTSITLLQVGVGQVTIVGGSGVTVNKYSAYNLKTAGPYSVVQLIRTATNSWVAFGALELG